VNEFQNKDIIGGSEKSLSWNNGLFDLLILTILQGGRGGSGGLGSKVEDKTRH